MESDHESDWSDAPELEEEVEVTKSLFCAFEGTPEECLKQDKSKFGWSLDELSLETEYDFIKLVNFCRSKNYTEAPDKEEILKLKIEWSKDEFFKPVMDNDPFLMHDWDKQTRNNSAPGVKNANTNDARRTEIERMLEETEVSAPRENEGYFDSYADYGIHAEMLQDTHRTESYRDIMYKNKNLFKDKIVVDVGAGTGILSMFAARAGAKKVYALEMSDIAFDCLDVIRDNGLNDIIEVKKGNAEEIAKSLPKCDIIVSEWMGYCLLFEGMLDSVLKVRDLILKPGGKMIPATARIDLCLVSTEKLWKDYLGFWDDVYGFKMKSLKKRARREARINGILAKEVASPIQNLKEWDLGKCSIADLSFSSSVRLSASNSGKVHGVCASFDCNMAQGAGVENHVVLSTSPFSTPTHWKQATFLFDQPVEVKPGSLIEGKMEIKRKTRNDRELEVRLKLNLGKDVICNQTYSVS